MDAPLEVIAVDHVYVAVSDLVRSEAFYDPVMAMLGFKKGTRPIAGEPHIHYFNRITQYTLRPARGAGAADPYQVGALHHMCFRVAGPEVVDEAYRRLAALGIEASEPRLYEYRPDYYAIFFTDPDGTRLEIVAEGELRRTLRDRWDELDGFVDPVSRLPPPAPAISSAGNLGADIPADLPDELITILAATDTVRVERIVSRGHTSPAGFWYDQDSHELVFLLEGAARLSVEGQGTVDLGPGDWLLIDAHLRHRLDWTAPDADTIWLAIHFRGPRPVSPG